MAVAYESSVRGRREEGGERRKEEERGGRRRREEEGGRRKEGGGRRKEERWRMIENEEGEEEMSESCHACFSDHTPHLYYRVTVDLNSFVVHLNRKPYQSPEDRVSLLTNS